jgi:hypothetical protein
MTKGKEHNKADISREMEQATLTTGECIKG